MKFIHCADVHLDTPLQGLAEYEGAPIAEIRNATRRAFDKVLDAAITEAADFLIIAGDLYDTGLKSFESALFFNSRMARLAEHNIEVYLIYGNHDAASKLIKQLRPPRNVHVFRSSEPQTFRNEVLRVAIHGQSFSTPEITQDLAAKYPPPVKGFFNVGVLHTNLGGISDHANYAPCSIETLRNKGYQYWALGHVHNRQVLCNEPYILYPGNTQGRHGREQGEKSCELVSVTETGKISITPISTSVVPWIEVTIDASRCKSADAVYEDVRSTLSGLLLRANDRIIAVRVTIAGTTEAHTELSRDPEQVRNEVISVANECGSGALWLERIDIETSAPRDQSALIARDDPIGEIVRVAQDLRREPPTLETLRLVTELNSKLPPGLWETNDSPPLSVVGLMKALDQAESLLLARISSLDPQ